MSKSVSDKVVRNHADNVPFSAILQARLSRRTVARGGLSAARANQRHGRGVPAAVNLRVSTATGSIP